MPRVKKEALDVSVERVTELKNSVGAIESASSLRISNMEPVSLVVAGFNGYIGRATLILMVSQREIPMSMEEFDAVERAYFHRK